MLTLTLMRILVTQCVHFHIENMAAAFGVTGRRLVASLASQYRWHKDRHAGFFCFLHTHPSALSEAWFFRVESLYEMITIII